MDDDARNRGRMLALILGGAALVLGAVALLLDLFRGEGVSAGSVAVIVVGLVVVASVRGRSGTP